ncbi:MAG: hypothetical protein ACI9YT_002129 [Halobacteriales archaeon]|jgi:hypothetical protein
MGEEQHSHLREWAELVGDEVPESVLEEVEEGEPNRSRRAN